MSVETLDPRQPRRIVVQLLRTRRVVDLEPGPDAKERQHGQPTRVSGSASGWKHMIRACSVVASRFGRVAADEQRAVVPEARGGLPDHVRVDVKVFRRDDVAGGDRVGDGRSDEEPAVAE